ncbi:MAG: hypothetical protein K8953_12280, partial [Proteobacteria bacterium]|nr:hypothetical protein [Pseudomonadota bacterium]
PRNPECEEPTRTGNADYALWQWNAVKADKTTPLGILPEITKDDPSVSYVETARGATLQRGFLLDSSGRVVRSDINVRPINRALTLSNLGVSGDIASQSGLTLYRVTLNEVEGVSEIRHYVGLWLDTDMGAPLPSNTTVADWNAKISAFLLDTAGNLNEGTGDFILEVNFNAKTVKTKDGAPAVLTRFSKERGTIKIDGKFTDLGVIYGRSELTLPTVADDDNLNGEVSTGSLTGLIGESGAVGAFISDGAQTAAGAYVGGFVAMNPNACDATPFSAFCKSTTAYGTVRFQACIDGVTDAGVYAGCPDLIVDLCPSSGRRHELCPPQVVRTGVTDFIRWRETARDGNNENKLVILQEIEGFADPEGVSF